MKKRSILILIAVICIFALALTACAPADDGNGEGEGGGTEANTEPIKIGGSYPLTGNSADAGIGCRDAMLLAIEEINAAGGIYGRPLELCFEDDESTAASSVSAVEKLCMQDQVVALVAAYNSACVLAHMEITQREGVPQICPVASAAAITRPAQEYMFRNIPSTIIMGTMYADFMFEEAGQVTDWVIIRETSDYALDYVTHIGARLEELGVTFLTEETYNSGDTDFYSQLTKIKNMDAKAILFIGYVNEGSQIMKQYHELGMENIPIFTTGSCATDDFYKVAGENAEGLYSLSMLERYEDNPNPLANEYMDNYYARFNNNADYFSSATYDAVYILAEAFKRVYDNNGGVWPEDLADFRTQTRDAIASINGDWTGVQGTLYWNEYNEATVDMYWVQWQADGTRRIVDILPASSYAAN